MATADKNCEIEFNRYNYFTAESMAESGFEPLTTFRSGRPLQIQYPVSMQLLAASLPRLPQVQAVPYQPGDQLAALVESPMIIIADTIDMVLSEELIHTKAQFVLVRSQKQHLEGRLPDRVLAVVEGQAEVMRFLLHQLEPKGHGLFLSRLYDGTFKQRCKQLGRAFGVTLIQEFSNQSEIQKVIQKNPFGRVIVVVPYQSIPPLASTYEEVIYTGSSQLDELTFLQSILLANKLRALPAERQPSVHHNSILGDGKDADEVSKLPETVFPQPVFLRATSLADPPRLPTPILSAHALPANALSAKFKVIDLDPLSCMKLQMFCLTGGHRFIRAESYRDLYRSVVDSEPGEQILVITSKENFQLIRDLSELARSVAIVMLYSHEQSLSDAEIRFKQEFNVNVLVSDKNHLAQILGNTPDMVFSGMRPAVPTYPINIENSGFRRASSVFTGKDYRAESVSLVETFDYNNPPLRNIVQSQDILAVHSETEEFGLQRKSELEVAPPDSKQIVAEKCPIYGEAKHSQINSSSYPEILTEYPNQLISSDIVKEDSNIKKQEYLEPLEISNHTSDMREQQQDQHKELAIESPAELAVQDAPKAISCQIFAPPAASQPTEFNNANPVANSEPRLLAAECPADTATPQQLPQHLVGLTRPVFAELTKISDLPADMETIPEPPKQSPAPDITLREGLAEPVFTSFELQKVPPELATDTIESGVAEGHTAPEIEPVAEKSYADSERGPKISVPFKGMVLQEELPKQGPVSPLIVVPVEPQPRISDLMELHGFSISPPFTEQKCLIEAPTQPTIDNIEPIPVKLSSQPSIELAVSPLLQPEAELANKQAQLPIQLAQVDPVLLEEKPSQNGKIGKIRDQIMPPTEIPAEVQIVPLQTQMDRIVEAKTTELQFIRKPSGQKSEKVETQKPSREPSERSAQKSVKKASKEPSEKSSKRLVQPEQTDMPPNSSTSLQQLVPPESPALPAKSQPLVSAAQLPSEADFSKKLSMQETPPLVYGKSLQSLALKKLPSSKLSQTSETNTIGEPTPTRLFVFNRVLQPTLTLVHKDLISQPFIQYPQNANDMMIFESLGELLFILHKESKVPNARISVKTIHSTEYHFIPSMQNVTIVRYVIGQSSSLERTRVKTPLFKRKGSLSREKDEAIPMLKKQINSNPAAEYQTTGQDLNVNSKRSFIKRMFNKELVYILVEDRKMSLVARIEGVKNFNTRLRLETYNQNNVLQIAMGLVHDHSLVIVTTEEQTMEHLRSFLMTYNVPLLYCNSNANQLIVPPESNIYPLTNKRQILEMIASIPRFFSASSSTKTTVKSVLLHQVIHLYFESSVTEGYKREIIELAEQQKRKIVPHEIQNHHEIQCLSENMKDEMFVCVVKSQSMYEALLQKPAPNLLVYWTQTERDGLGKLFAQLRTLISKKNASKRHNKQLAADSNEQRNEYGYGLDLNKRLINVEFKKLLKSQNSSGISNKSGAENLEGAIESTPQFQSPAMEPIPSSNIIENFHPPRYNISKLDSVTDSMGNVQLLVERNNHELKEMLMGMQGVNSQEYFSIQGMQSIFEMYRTTGQVPLLVVVSDRNTLRYVSELKRMYPQTEYVAVLNMVEMESEISEGARRFRKPKLNEYLKDVLFAVETNRRLAILLAARAEISRKRLPLNAAPPPALSANYTRLCIFYKQPKDDSILNNLRQRILKPLANSCMYLGYQSPNDVADSLNTLDRLNEHILCVVLERDDDIPDLEAQLIRNYRNLHVRFVRIFSKSFKGYVALKDNPNILTENDSEAKILQFIEDFLVGGSSNSSNAPTSRATSQPIEMVTSQEIIIQAEEAVNLAKSPSVVEEVMKKQPSPTEEPSIIDFQRSSTKQQSAQQEESVKKEPEEENPYNLPIPQTMKQSSSQQKDATEQKSSVQVGAGMLTSRESSKKLTSKVPTSNMPSSKFRRATSVREALRKKPAAEEQSVANSSQLVPSIYSHTRSNKQNSNLHPIASMPMQRQDTHRGKSRAHSQC